MDKIIYKSCGHRYERDDEDNEIRIKFPKNDCDSISKIIFNTYQCLQGKPVLFFGNDRTIKDHKDIMIVREILITKQEIQEAKQKIQEIKQRKQENQTEIQQLAKKMILIIACIIGLLLLSLFLDNISQILDNISPIIL